MPRRSARIQAQKRVLYAETTRQTWQFMVMQCALQMCKYMKVKVTNTGKRAARIFLFKHCDAEAQQSDNDDLNFKPAQPDEDSDLDLTLAELAERARMRKLQELKEALLCTKLAREMHAKRAEAEDNACESDSSSAVSSMSGTGPYANHDKGIIDDWDEIKPVNPKDPVNDDDELCDNGDLEDHVDDDAPQHTEKQQRFLQSRATYSYTDYFQKWCAKNRLLLPASCRDDFKVCMQILLDPVRTARCIVFPSNAPQVAHREDLSDISKEYDTDELSDMYSITHEEYNETDMNASIPPSPMSSDNDECSMKSDETSHCSASPSRLPATLLSQIPTPATPLSRSPSASRCNSPTPATPLARSPCNSPTPVTPLPQSPCNNPTPATPLARSPCNSPTPVTPLSRSLSASRCNSPTPVTPLSQSPEL